MLPTLIWTPAGERPLEGYELPLSLDRLVPGGGPWEVELGFGKGRFLLRSAAERADRRYLGIEVASPYYRMARDRAARRDLQNLFLVRGEARFVLTVALPRGFADVLHVYFPDPWPKSRHQRRRFLDAESVDLLAGVLRPGGTICFATDFVEFGRETLDLLRRHPALAVTRRADPWPGGPRTNYEAKYLREGRPILRLEARLAGVSGDELLHPLGRMGVVCAWDAVGGRGRGPGTGGRATHPDRGQETNRPAPGGGRSGGPGPRPQGGREGAP